MTRVLLWNLLLALVWALSTAGFTPQNLVLGWVIGMLALRYFNPLPEAPQYTTKLRRVVVFALLYAWRVLVSSLQVAGQVLFPRGLRPGFVRVPLDARTDLEITLLANLISFSPGSLCVEIAGDRSEMLVHVMSVEDPGAAVAYIKTRLEAPILEILR